MKLEIDIKVVGSVLRALRTAETKTIEDELGYHDLNIPPDRFMRDLQELKDALNTTPEGRSMVEQIEAECSIIHGNLIHLFDGDTGRAIRSQQLTDEQISKAFEACIGVSVREADKAVIKELGNTRDVLAEYIWDHWMGEPENPSLKMVRAIIDELLGPEDYGE